MNNKQKFDFHEVNSIYIHIPFCKTKCPYCDFASWAGKEHLIDEYFNALTNEIRTKCNAYKSWKMGKEELLSAIKTIFIGGGTPSLIAPEYYERVFHEIRKYFLLAKDCEITLELNPGTAREDFLQGYKKLGVNRISIGSQSFNEEILVTLGRKHSIQDTVDAIHQVKSAGFENFNLDLIYAVPEMKRKTWIETIYKALEFQPKHISAYSLTIENGTPFAVTYSNPTLLPDGDFTYELYMDLCQILKKENFMHYEISNFAKPSYKSKHNINYWLGNDFFAFGNGAYRCLNSLRTRNLRNVDAYIKCPCVEEFVEQADNQFDKVMLNSRLNDGVELDLLEEVSNKEHEDLLKVLDDLSNEGYLKLDNDRVVLTDKGFFVSNEILIKLVG